MLHGLPSEAPWNQGYESTPDFHCAHADCPEAAWAPNDFKLCETCGKHYCADHIARLDDLYLCDECRVCAVCGDGAAVQCDVCNGLVCGAHARTYRTQGGHGVACEPYCNAKVAPGSKTHPNSTTYDDEQLAREWWDSKTPEERRAAVGDCVGARFFGEHIAWRCLSGVERCNRTATLIDAKLITRRKPAVSADQESELERARR